MGPSVWSVYLASHYGRKIKYTNLHFSSSHDDGLGNYFDLDVFSEYIPGSCGVSLSLHSVPDIYMTVTTSRSSRVFLGITEAGLFPGVAYYIALWYPRQMQARRLALFESAATLAGAFGGLLAYVFHWIYPARAQHTPS